MRFPIIRVRDKSDGRIHTVGEDIHDTLLIDMDHGTISYYNLQNGCGTRFADAEYEFVPDEELKEWSDAVNFAPTTETVKRGGWFECDDEMECSRCGSAWNYCDNDTERFRFCPNCGARNEGERA